MNTTIYYAKLNQERYWRNPLRKGKGRVTKMSEEDFLKYTSIVNEIKNGKH